MVIVLLLKDTMNKLVISVALIAISGLVCSCDTPPETEIIETATPVDKNSNHISNDTIRGDSNKPNSTRAGLRSSIAPGS
ncbi:MAG: hypothetical protein U5L96_21200 [Owenweeksia sp.]|nr:hypothetical protein [Owenweeksia sp.]